MTVNGPIGVVGGGLIGMSWASLFLAHGADVVVTDPRSSVRDELDRFVADAWPHLSALGLTTAETPARAEFSTDFSVLAGVTHVQENAPDRIEAKQQVISQLEAVLDPSTIIASSTSSLKATDIQAGAQNPERVLVAHPMNPPHLVPMVELVGGELTSPESIDRAEAFYQAMNRVPIRVKKEVPGHLANRLTAALYREAVHLVAEGIADVAEIDRAIAYGPGMRWALMGPHLTYHLGGGAGGYRHYLDHLGPTQEARWRDLGQSSLTNELKDKLVAGVDAELKAQDADTLIARRDAALVALTALKQQYGL